MWRIIYAKLLPTGEVISACDAFGVGVFEDHNLVVEGNHRERGYGL